MELNKENIEFQTALELTNDTNLSFFLTGKAGTGKSTLLKYIVKNISKNFVVVAPTGIAAVNVGGVTIHSFFQFPLRPLLLEDNGIKVFSKDSEKRKIISALDTLIIDEVSMVRADLIDAIDYSLRKNGGNSNLPFGGKQVIFVGDIYQLEPVTIRVSGDQQIINELYGSAYFYNAKVFKRIEFLTLELKKVYRQNDSLFISLLDKVRVNQTSQEDINAINSRVFSESELKKNEFAITLTTRNDLAYTVNHLKLSELKSKSFKFNATISGEFEESKYPTESELTLKEGAQVIFIRNDIDKRWVNGTIGQISELTESVIKVKLKDDSIYSVEKRDWENVKYHFNKEKKKIEANVVGVFTQYPIKLAWAITIHKSQGLTFEKVIIDFGSGTFASGQAYVALSRCVSLDGLFLKHRISTKDIYLDSEVIEFAKSLNGIELINEKLSIGRDLFRFLKCKDFETIGKYYFVKAIVNTMNGDFKTAFNELISGFENVTCDCTLQNLEEKNQLKIIKSLKTKVINCTATEFDFLRSVFYFFLDSKYFEQEQNEMYLKSLTLINSYLENDANSEVGHYIKSRILQGLGNYNDSLKELNVALAIKNTPRTHYQIGRIKVEKLESIGINSFYQSVLLNPSSLCGLRWFKDECDKKEIKLLVGFDKLLANLFNTLETNEFLKIVSELRRYGSIELADDTVLTASSAFDSFLNGLKEDACFFDDSFSNGEDDSSMEYTSNNEEFSSSFNDNVGDYGFDEDTLNTAFDGDSENYWNID